MPLTHLGIVSLLRWGRHFRRPSGAARSGRRRARRGLRLGPELLEPRLTPSYYPNASTYVWTALGDKMSWNDPNNWSHFGPQIGVPLTGTPTVGSNIVFPPVATLPAGSPTTIHFNSTSGAINFPINTLTIQDSYTFQGNPVTINNGVVVLNPHGAATNATILLAGLTLNRGASIYAQEGSTLTVGSTANPTGVQLNLQGGASKSGGGQLVIDTSNVFDPEIGLSLQSFEVSGGTLILGVSTAFTGTKFLVDAGAELAEAGGVAAQVGSIAGAGQVDLEGTAATAAQTSLRAVVPVPDSDQLTGSITGLGQFIKDGNGTLTTGSINFGGAGSVQVLLGALDLDGSLNIGGLEVGTGATFGGLGTWNISGPASFQAGSTFAVALDGLTAGSGYTQLVDGDSTSGIALGNSTLSATIGYEYQAGDQFTIATGPLIQGRFQNAARGIVVLGNNVPFAVSYSSAAVTLTALQSETTTALTGSPSPSHPGQPVSLTATVSTRTAPVTTGTVSFEQGTTVLATLPLSGSGTSTFTTTALPLGSTGITAVYNGSTNILGSTSPIWTQAVVPYSTTTRLTSSANPGRPGQPVTFTASVLAAGMPVTAGTVSFTRGKQLLGTAPLDNDGTARLTVSTLPVGSGRIQAIFNGTPDDLSSLSPSLVQAVDRFSTTTSLILTTQAQANGQVRSVLVATVASEGASGQSPVGTVIFRRNGHTLGRARLTGGTAVLAIGRRAPSRGTFVASYQGNSRFQPSTSARIGVGGTPAARARRK